MTVELAEDSKSSESVVAVMGGWRYNVDPEMNSGTSCVFAVHRRRSGPFWSLDLFERMIVKPPIVSSTFFLLQ
jgi:hypothetical protein